MLRRGLVQVFLAPVQDLVLETLLLLRLGASNPLWIIFILSLFGVTECSITGEVIKGMKDTLLLQPRTTVLLSVASWVFVTLNILSFT